MSFLNKTSEFFNAEKFHSRTFECFKNPTEKEWNEIGTNVRGVITDNGDVYGWNYILLHDNAITLFNIPDGIHFDGNKSKIDIYLIPGNNIETLYDAFNNASSLYNFLTNETRIGMISTNYYKAENNDLYYYLNTVNDILNYKDILEKIQNTKEILTVNSRLKKKAEFFSAEEYKGQYIECFKNPTSKEWQDASDFKPIEGVRAIITNEGDVYGWTGELLHSYALKIFGLPEGVHLSGHLEGNIGIFATKEMTPQYMKEAFERANSLYNVFSNSTRVTFIETSYYGAYAYDAYDTFKTIGDILNYKEEEYSLDEINDNNREMDKIKTV